MKRIASLLLLLSYTFLAEAQDEELNRKMSVGGHLGQYQNDFGIGLNITSPYFASSSMAVRFRSNVMWHQHPSQSETTWTPYSNFSLGVVVAVGEMGGFVRTYSEGGLILLVPSDDFSSESSVLGGYGLIGVEFFSASFVNYYFEVGAAGTGANADNIPGEPIYSNGLIIQTGFRFHLGR